MLHRQMIIWTSILVTGLALVIGLVILQPPTPEALLEKSPRYARMLRVREKALEKLQARTAIPTTDLSEKREPASNNIVLPPTDNPAALVADLQLSCGPSQTVQFPRSVAQVRLSGHACAPASEIVSTEIRNDTNGSGATVFASGPATFVTDYIALAPGPNHIRILHVLKRGGREERAYDIDRALKPAKL